MDVLSRFQLFRDGLYVLRRFLAGAENVRDVDRDRRSLLVLVLPLGKFMSLFDNVPSAQISIAGKDLIEHFFLDLRQLPVGWIIHKPHFVIPALLDVLFPKMCFRRGSSLGNEIVNSA